MQSHNRLIKVTLPSGVEYKYSYGDYGLVNEIVNPLDVCLLKNGYDLMQNLVFVSEPNGAETNYIYNALNRLETVVNPDRNKVSLGTYCFPPMFVAMSATGRISQRIGQPRKDIFFIEIHKSFVRVGYRPQER